MHVFYEQGQEMIDFSLQTRNHQRVHFPKKSVYIICNTLHGRIEGLALLYKYISEKLFVSISLLPKKDR